jgi:hypothetical protein
MTILEYSDQLVTQRIGQDFLQKGYSGKRDMAWVSVLMKLRTHEKQCKL